MIQPLIKRDSVRVAAQHAARTTTAPAAGEQPHAKRARLLRVDGAVRALEITCTCGETTVVELEYPKSTEEPR